MGLKMALLYGGQSSEHEVSVMSAASVAQAIRGRIEVLPIGISKDGQWIPGLAPESLVERGCFEVSGGHGAAADADRIVQNRNGFLLGYLRETVDLVFPLLHGPMGEDGTVQGLLELAGIPYIGGGVMASAAGMDKEIMKALFKHHGLPVGDYLVFRRHEWEKDRARICTAIEDRLGYPCFVKPANMGSSVGISKAHNRAELEAAFSLALNFDRKVVVEAFLDGYEVECAVLGNEEPRASVPGEIVPGAEFYSYEDKYVKNDSELIIPARLTPEQTAEVQDLAVRAFKAVDCAGMGRVDFFVLKRDGRILVNEINTIPGFTKISMYPKLWAASGVPYPELIERLAELALERFRDRPRGRKA
ncbi:MAG TPA: D-alanine--D-alanine ligase [Firmicutes bacterium]|uniref:D-alanine--D-alanine ligase n=1 Tax=Capillibacterium thermochitinicola TaxID=2699427 RepID=A0A8J6LSC3_9FIRM|nr:D-alanine--D-alanine ligase family protein [Capillibacterium thermochitinicola]MBA2133157.1 D-alanine--D-alanine ligase [Capillibacterium thermochitinicola]HHW11700.1 D-alanine--D-alanine ligase [Bacillota bacterium]